MLKGIQVRALVLRLDDYLWFSSYEWGGSNETAPVLHNYALSFALSRHDRVLAMGSVPTYEDDLGDLDIYATPARLVPSRRLRQRSVFTFNSVDNPTQLTQALGIGEKVNDPKLGKRQVLLPGLRFEMVAFLRRGAQPPRVFRLGKKRSPVVVEQSLELSGTLFDGNETPDHAVNPLDVSGSVTMCIPRPMPPHMIYERASIENDRFLRAGRTVVHLPKRVRAWASA